MDLWRPTLAPGWRRYSTTPRCRGGIQPRRARRDLATASLHGFRAAPDDHGFTEIQTPKFVSSATESGANAFQVDYFGRPAYLVQSPQFYKQTIVGVFGRVNETGPVFRAEPYDTARHLAEYVSLDAELGFISDHRDVLAVLRHALSGMAAAVRSQAQHAADLLGITIPEVPEQIPVIHFSEALKPAGAPPDQPNIAPAHERAVGRWADTDGSEFVAVEGYPMRKRPFYTHPQPGNERWSNSFDLLFRGVELVMGGRRLHRHADYVAAILAGAKIPRPTRTTWKPSRTACRRTAGSPSDWSARPPA